MRFSSSAFLNGDVCGDDFVMRSCIVALWRGVRAAVDRERRDAGTSATSASPIAASTAGLLSSRRRCAVGVDRDVDGRVDRRLRSRRRSAVRDRGRGRRRRSWRDVRVFVVAIGARRLRVEVVVDELRGDAREREDHDPENHDDPLFVLLRGGRRVVSSRGDVRQTRRDTFAAGTGVGDAASRARARFATLVARPPRSCRCRSRSSRRRARRWLCRPRRASPPRSPSGRRA